MTFLGQHRGDAHHTPHESPKAMTVPLIILAVLSAIGGLVGIPELFKPNAHKLSDFLAPVFEDANQYMAHHEAPAHSTEWMMIGVSTLLIVVVIFVAIKRFSNAANATKEAEGVGKFLENKWYVDELYDAMIVKPLMALGDFLNTVVEKSGIDRLVNGVGKAVQYSSRQLRLLQSGNVGGYLLMMVIAIILLIRLVFYLKM
jgi:NADH-quinone oxidoreductase subunit L